MGQLAIHSLVLDRVGRYVVMVVLFAAGLPVLLHILPDSRQQYGVVLPELSRPRPVTARRSTDPQPADVPAAL